MKNLLNRTALTSALVLALSNPVFAEEAESTADIDSATCSIPETSPIIPDGNVASEDELVDAQSAVKKFQKVLGGYRDCLKTEDDAIDPNAENVKELKQVGIDKYNASVDVEEKVVGEFSAAVAAFKARN